MRAGRGWRGREEEGVSHARAGDTDKEIRVGDECGRVARAEAGAPRGRAATRGRGGGAEGDERSGGATHAANDMGVRCESASRRARATKTTRGTPARILSDFVGGTIQSSSSPSRTRPRAPAFAPTRLAPLAPRPGPFRRPHTSPRDARPQDVWSRAARLPLAARPERVGRARARRPPPSRRPRGARCRPRFASPLASFPLAGPRAFFPRVRRREPDRRHPRGGQAQDGRDQRLVRGGARGDRGGDGGGGTTYFNEEAEYAREVTERTLEMYRRLCPEMGEEERAKTQRDGDEDGAAKAEREQTTTRTTTTRRSERGRGEARGGTRRDEGRHHLFLHYLLVAAPSRRHRRAFRSERGERARVIRVTRWCAGAARRADRALSAQSTPRRKTFCCAGPLPPHISTVLV